MQELAEDLVLVLNYFKSVALRVHTITQSRVCVTDAAFVSCVAFN